MYEVIKMYGDWEPWWFIDGWRDDIIYQKEYEKWEDALADFQNQWNHLKETYPSIHSQKNLLATFWQESEKKWCEDCADDLQQYHSILLLKNNDIIPLEKNIASFEQRNDIPPVPFICKLRLKKVNLLLIS
ncbi:DUF1033 family protein [Streptococcus parauberis]|nr:DUF1033 family protein [Streptococcus parauberis]